MHLTSSARGLPHPLCSLKIPSGWPVAALALPHSSLPPCSDVGLLIPTLLNYLMSQFCLVLQPDTLLPRWDFTLRPNLGSNRDSPLIQLPDTNYLLEKLKSQNLLYLDFLSAQHSFIHVCIHVCMHLSTYHLYHIPTCHLSIYYLLDLDHNPR